MPDIGLPLASSAVGFVVSETGLNHMALKFPAFQEQRESGRLTDRAPIKFCACQFLPALGPSAAPPLGADVLLCIFSAMWSLQT